MKKLIICLVAIFAIVFGVQVYAAELNNLAEEQRPTKSFERIRLQGSPDIKYAQGKTCSVRVKAPQNIIKNIETRVEGNCLIVSMKNNRFFSFSSIKGGEVTVYVTSPDLIGVEVQGSGDFECKSLLDTDNMEVSLRGSGDVNFADIICDRIKTSLVGSGDIEIKNVTAQQSSVELVGSGDVKIKQNKVKQTQLELKGSGDIKISCNNCDVVNCRLVGSGDITLSGTVKKLNRSTRGSGDIETGGLRIVK